VMVKEVRVHEGGDAQGSLLGEDQRLESPEVQRIGVQTLPARQDHQEQGEEDGGRGESRARRGARRSFLGGGGLPGGGLPLQEDPRRDGRQQQGGQPRDALDRKSVEQHQVGYHEQPHAGGAQRKRGGPAFRPAQGLSSPGEDLHQHSRQDQEKNKKRQPTHSRSPLSAARRQPP